MRPFVHGSVFLQHQLGVRGAVCSCSSLVSCVASSSTFRTVLKQIGSVVHCKGLTLGSMMKSCTLSIAGMALFLL